MSQEECELAQALERAMPPQPVSWARCSPDQLMFKGLLSALLCTQDPTGAFPV